MRTRDLLILFFLLGFYLVGTAQSEREFTDQAGRYRIRLVGDWQPAAYTDAVGRQKTEFVYKSRDEGLLQIQRVSLGSRSLDEFVRGEIEGLEGCVVTDRAAVEGEQLPGQRLVFYASAGNRRVIAVHYYLEESGAVWLLRFTGKAGSLDIMREITDRMARSFRPLAFAE